MGDGPDTVEGMLDVLYNMDYEDVIGGGEVKTRFRYTSVPKHDYGIPVQQMLDMVAFTHLLSTSNNAFFSFVLERFLWY